MAKEKKKKPAKGEDTKTKKSAKPKKEAKADKPDKKDKGAKSKKAKKGDGFSVMDFLVAKGERIALGGAAFLALLFVFWGFSKTFGEGAEKKIKTLNQQISSLRTQVANPPPPTPFSPPSEEDDPAAYPTKKPDQFVTHSLFFNPGTIGFNKGKNPPILPPGYPVEGEKGPRIQLASVWAPVKVIRKDETQRVLHVYKSKGVAAGAPGTPGGTGEPEYVPMPGGPGAETGTVMTAQTPDVEQVIQPHQMVVVYTSFLYEEQVKLFQEALRKKRKEELLNDPKLMPKVLGIEVKRCRRIVPDGVFSDVAGAFSPWEDVYAPGETADAVFQSKPGKAIHTLLTSTPFETTQTQKYQKYIQPGLVTPFPELAHESYPKVKVPGFKATEGVTTNPDGETGRGSSYVPPAVKGGKPGLPPGFGEGDNGQQGAGLARKTFERVSIEKFAKTNKSFYARLQGKFYPFASDGQSPAPREKGKGTGMGENPEMEQSPMPGPGGKGVGDAPSFPGAVGPGGPMTTTGEIPKKLLIRFIDVDVQPGETYVYGIRLRVANPNYQQFEKVIFPTHAEQKVLYSPWTITPSITLADELNYYVSDPHFQVGNDLAKLRKEVKKFIDVPKNPRPKESYWPGMDNRQRTDEQVSFQIHKWVKTFKSRVTDSEVKGGLWAIATRVLLERGQYVETDEIPVAMPKWDSGSGQFVVRKYTPQRKTKKKKTKPYFTGVAFRPPNRQVPPLLVDFKGGPETSSAAEALLMTADGRLLVFNEQEDTDTSKSRDVRDDSTNDNDTPRGRVRYNRKKEWLKQVNEAVVGGATTGTNPMGPGQPPSGLPGFGGGCGPDEPPF